MYIIVRGITMIWNLGQVGFVNIDVHLINSLTFFFFLKKLFFNLCTEYFGTHMGSRAHIW